jgi:hypothetical protein
LKVFKDRGIVRDAEQYEIRDKFAIVFFLPLKKRCCEFRTGLAKKGGLKNVSKTGLPDGIFSNQKSQSWVNFGGPWKGKGWYILWPVGIHYLHRAFGTLYGLLVFLRKFGIVFPNLVNCVKKNLAILVQNLNFFQSESF